MRLPLRRMLCCMLCLPLRRRMLCCMLCLLLRRRMLCCMLCRVMITEEGLVLLHEHVCLLLLLRVCLIIRLLVVATVFVPRLVCAALTPCLISARHLGELERPLIRQMRRSTHSMLQWVE